MIYNTGLSKNILYTRYSRLDALISVHDFNSHSVVMFGILWYSTVGTVQYVAYYASLYSRLWTCVVIYCVVTVVQGMAAYPSCVTRAQLYINARVPSLMVTVVLYYMVKHTRSWSIWLGMYVPYLVLYLYNVQYDIVQWSIPGRLYGLACHPLKLAYFQNCPV